VSLQDVIDGNFRMNALQLLAMHVSIFLKKNNNNILYSSMEIRIKIMVKYKGENRLSSLKCTIVRKNDKSLHQAHFIFLFLS
jgi:hypothetical protein